MARFPRPKISARTDYEGELGVVIAAPLPARARVMKTCVPYILGYTCVDDFTARDLQSKDGSGRAKSFDTSFVQWARWLK